MTARSLQDMPPEAFLHAVMGKVRVYGRLKELQAMSLRKQTNDASIEDAELREAIVAAEKDIEGSLSLYLLTHIPENGV